MRPFLLSALSVFALASCGHLSRQKPEAARAPYFEETHSSLTGKVSFSKSSGYEYAKIDCGPDSKLSQSVMLPEGAAAPRKIDPAVTYDCEILASTYKRNSGTNRHPADIFTDRSLLRIRTGSRVVFDASICRIHKKAMTRQEERAESGGELPDSFYKTRDKRFPNDGAVYLLCGSGVSHMLWKCHDCEAASRRWQRLNGFSNL